MLDIVPATDIDLSFIGIPAFFLPGLNTGIIDPIVIPVELIDFTANSESGEVTLNWSTSTETNNLGFQIERSDEHRNFESVGFVNGSGTTTESQEYTFVDKSVELGKYYYRLKQIDYDGSIDYSRVIEVSITAPMDYQLSQNFPNPFNPNTTIEFSIPINSVVVLTVFNLVGQEVVTLVNEEFGAGNYSVVWNGTDWKGSQVSSGVYLYEIKVIGINGGEYQKMKKMILLK
ncbi:MAG: FlgD immunoglobulin-like domain containing protein [Ignavibacteriaceae bacterium]